jgi:protein-L-isoaspartate(D-aspartate) O-methyltransferase
MDGRQRSRDQSFPWAAEWPEITNPRVRAAFARVERRRFLPTSIRDLADRDAPLPIGEGQTISQPFVIALMIQALELEAGQRVLEVGSGSGYQTALLCELAREQGRDLGETVYSIERFPSLLLSAREALESQGYFPHLRSGDGAAGWPEAAPFHAIVVSAAAQRVPLPLWEQLAVGGRLVVPVGASGDDQMLWLLHKTTKGRVPKAMGPVRFVPLISALLDDPANGFRVP